MAHGNGICARVFQAIRIAVNDEILELQNVLDSAASIIEPGGVVCVISYHSLEDRAAKYWLRSGCEDGQLLADSFGRHLTPWQPVRAVWPLVPSHGDRVRNSRCRSAKLRCSVRNELPWPPEV